MVENFGDKSPSENAGEVEQGVFTLRFRRASRYFALISCYYICDEFMALLVRRRGGSEDKGFGLLSSLACCHHHRWKAAAADCSFSRLHRCCWSASVRWWMNSNVCLDWNRNEKLWQSQVGISLLFWQCGGKTMYCFRWNYLAVLIREMVWFDWGLYVLDL